MSDQGHQTHSDRTFELPPSGGRHDASCKWLCRSPLGPKCRASHSCAFCAHEEAVKAGRSQFRNTLR
jgi:hypothetical protein